MRYLDIPADWLGGVMFTSKSIPGPHRLSVGGAEWCFGIAPPIDRGPDYKKPRLESLSVAHARLLFVLLEQSRRAGGPPDLAPRALCNLMWEKSGGKYFKKLIELLNDLERTYVRITHDGTTSVSMPILHEPKYQTDKRHNHVLREIRLSDPFVNHLNTVERTLKLRLDVFLKLRHRISAAGYLYLPSRAIGRHRAGNGRFEIGLSTFLRQIGETVPRAKSDRLRVIRRGGVDVIGDLHGAEISSGRITVDLWETVDRSDYKLAIGWVPEVPMHEADKPLFRRWYARFPNLKEDEARRRYVEAAGRRHSQLNDYDGKILEMIGVDLSSVQDLALIAEQLLAPGELSSIIGNLRERAQTLRNPTAAAIDAILKGIGPDPEKPDQQAPDPPRRVITSPSRPKPPEFDAGEGKHSTAKSAVDPDIVQRLLKTSLLKKFRSQNIFCATLKGSLLESAFTAWLNAMPDNQLVIHVTALSKEDLDEQI